MYSVGWGGVQEGGDDEKGVAADSLVGVAQAQRQPRYLDFDFVFLFVIFDHRFY